MLQSFGGPELLVLLVAVVLLFVVLLVVVGGAALVYAFLTGSWIFAEEVEDED